MHVIEEKKDAGDLYSLQKEAIIYIIESSS
jgi:hypothetical protein